MSKDITDMVKYKGSCHIFVTEKRCRSGYEWKSEKLLSIGLSTLHKNLI